MGNPYFGSFSHLEDPILLDQAFSGWLYIYNCWWNPRILAAELPVCAGGFVWKWGEHTSKWLFEIDHWPENLEVPYRQNSPYFFVKSAPRKPPVRMARWASPAPNPTATRPQRAMCGSIPRAEEVDEQSDAQKISCSVQLSFGFYTDYRVSRTHCNILQCIAILPAQLYCLGFNLKTAIYVGPQFFQHVDVAWREVIRRCLIPKLDGIGATRCPLQLESALKRSGWGVNFPCHGENDIAKSLCSVNNF